MPSWLGRALMDLRCRTCQRMIAAADLRGDRESALRWTRALEHAAGWDDLPNHNESETMNIPKMQPTTVIGIGAVVAAVAGPAAALIAHAITGDPGWTAGVGAVAGLAAGGVTHIVLPDNSTEPNAVDTLVRDAVNAAVSKNLSGALPTLLADGLAVVKAEQAPPTTGVAAAAAVSGAPAASPA